MKGKLIGYLVSATFVMLVVYVIFKVPAIKSFITGTTTTS